MSMYVLLHVLYIYIYMRSGVMHAINQLTFSPSKSLNCMQLLTFAMHAKGQMQVAS